MPNETDLKKNKKKKCAGEKRTRNLEAKQQAKGCGEPRMGWWAFGTEGGMEHFAVKGKKEQFKMMLNSRKDTQIKHNILWFITPSPTHSETIWAPGISPGCEIANRSSMSKRMVR